ncbi:MAG: hypothetical protein FWG10_06050 [Eubacteriaceae bacterium]|nr:hypothetical protein [Eubacteriaceae bacterium]
MADKKYLDKTDYSADMQKLVSVLIERMYGSELSDEEKSRREYGIVTGLIR